VFLVRVWPGEFAFMGVPVLGLGSAIVLGILFAVLGFAGDLAESALKRVAGAKNSGDLPGLGGVLDVLDSLLFVSPVFYGYLHLAAAVSDPIRGL
jgi:phosphatidate cytidylyltransferase